MNVDMDLGRGEDLLAVVTPFFTACMEDYQEMKSIATRRLNISFLSDALSFCRIFDLPVRF